MTHLKFSSLFSACLLLAVQSQGQDLVNLTNHASEDSDPAWSPDGTLIAFISDRDGNPEVFTMRPDGSETTQLTFTQDNRAPSARIVFNRAPSWSPDGKKLAFSSSGGKGEGYKIFTMNRDGTQIQQLTQPKGAVDQQPSWSLDGQRIVFTSSRANRCQLWIMNADGTDQQQLTTHLTGSHSYPFWFAIDPEESSMKQLTQTRWNEYEPVWSPDGTQIAFTSEKEDADPLYTKDSGIYVMDIAGSHNIRRLSPFPVRHIRPTWSPDGALIAFEDLEEGEIYVMSSQRSVTTVGSASWGKIDLHEPSSLH